MAEASPPPAFISRAGQSALLWVELVACIAMVGFRTYVQYRHNKKLYTNDWLILFALVCHLGSAMTSQLMIPPMYELEQLKFILATGEAPPANFMGRARLYLRYQFAVLITFWTTLWSVKFSLLLFFWRLFDSLRTRMRIFWYVMCFVTASTYIVTIFIQLFACGSPATFFNFGEQGCHTPRDIYLSNLVFLFSAGSDIACDVFLIFIPMPLLWKLQVSQRQKIILGIIFLLPLIPITFGILRLVFCNPTTGTVNVIKFTFYFMLENTAAIITACLPSMRLFFLQKTGTTTRPSQPYGAADISGGANVYGKQHSLFTNRSHRSEHKGAIPLSDVSDPPRREFEAASRESEESRSHIIQKGVLVTTEYQVSSMPARSDEDLEKSRW